MSIYAVNGKEPIAAWIESLDPEPITSSKATDLIGTNHGTLTNMDLTADPSTSRKPDTGSGGVRALDLDGSNDYIDCGTGVGTLLGTRNQFSISLWRYQKATPDNDGTYYFGDFAATQGVAQLSANGLVDFVRFNGTTYDRAGNVNAVGAWVHILISYDGSNVRTYKNGTLVTALSQAFTQTIAFGGQKLILGSYYAPGFTANILLDDVRIFDVALDATDAAYLAQSRGIVVSTGKKRLRINGSLINSGLCRSSI